ncbi:PilW family protein [Brassicibacter mesophilus]|uniref:PilW family protein n=1 Tax=Brassicibacter mesophilus TaxID=745119 RepID=UPI003D21B8D5
MKKNLKNQYGFTLLELIIVVPLIGIILLIAYNMLFLTTKSFNSVNDSFDISEDLRIFLISIQREANQAKKSEEKLDALHRVSQSELYIYTDIDDDFIPELVRYRLVGNEIRKDIKKASNSKYPFEFTNLFINERVVLSNVANTEIFSYVEKLKEPATEHEITQQEGKDYRRKVKMKLEISKSEGNKSIVIETYLVTKSRTEYE